MRKFALSCAAISLSVPATAAWADGACPDKITPELVTALGESTGSLDKGQTVYQPAGATMLGVSASYVVITREPGKDGIEEIDYRLGSAMRKYTDRYPADLRQAFDKAFSGARCASDKVTACSIVMESTAGAGALSSAGLGEGAFDVPASAHGAAIAQIKGDFARSDAGPVFLQCLYET